MSIDSIACIEPVEGFTPITSHQDDTTLYIDENKFTFSHIYDGNYINSISIEKAIFTSSIIPKLQSQSMPIFIYTAARKPLYSRDSLLKRCMKYFFHNNSDQIQLIQYAVYKGQVYEM